MVTYAVQLSNGYLDIPLHPDYQVGTGPFTFEFWIKPDKLGIFWIVSMETREGNGFKTLMQVSDPNISTAHDIIKIFMGDMSMQYDGEQETGHLYRMWTHVAITRADNKITFFLNGDRKLTAYSATTNVDIQLTSSLYIGVLAADNSNNAFSGLLTELRFWNIELDDVSIAQQMNQPVPGTSDGLLGYWVLDPQQKKAIDQTPRHNDGVYVGSDQNPFVDSGLTISSDPVGTSLSLDLPAYTRAQLGRGIAVHYTLDSSIADTSYVLAFAKHGEAIDPASTIPFVATTRAGSVQIAPEQPGWSEVPWVEVEWPPKDKIWDIVMATESALTPIAQAELIILDAPAIQHVAYDGATLNAAWSIQPLPPQIVVSSFVLKVYAGSTLLKSQSVEASQNTASFDVALNPGGAYVFDIQALSDRITDWQSDPVAVIAATPSITMVRCDNEFAPLQVSWEPLTTPAVGGYTVGLYQGDQLLQTAEIGDPTIGQATLNTELDPAEVYNVRINAKGSPIDPASTGPLSAPQPVVVAAPTIEQLSYDGTTWSAAWAAVPTPGVTGYVVTLCSEPGEQIIGTYSTQDTSLRVTPDPALDDDTVYGIFVQAVAGVSSGRRSPIRYLVSSKPIIAAVSYDGSWLRTSWPALNTSATPTTQYELALYDNNGDALIKRQITGASDAQVDPFSEPNLVSVSLAVSLDPAHRYAVRVQALDGEAKGLLSNPRPVIAAAPAILAVVSDGTAITVTWHALPGISSYTGALFDQREQLLFQADGAETGTLTIPLLQVSQEIEELQVKLITSPYVLQEGSRYSVRMNAKLGRSTGPWSEPVAVIGAAPIITAASYDGVQLDVSWSSVTSPDSSGYVVTLYQDARATQTLQTGRVTSTRFTPTLALDTGSSYTATVQAIGPGTSGPPSAPPTSVTVPISYFFSAPSTNIPYIFRADPRLQEAHDITLWLPDVFLNDQADNFQHGHFLLAKTDDSVFRYQITLAADSAAWQFDPWARATLRDGFIDLLRAIESAGLKPGGLSVVRQMIAQALPLTFDETLYYHYGFDASRGYVNLQPGMRIRVDSQSYQFVGTATETPALSGFVGSGTSFYDIGTYYNQGQLNAGFDAFLSALQRPAVPPNQGGAGGIIDLYAAGRRANYYRLFYPASLASSDSRGLIGAQNNLAILAADTFASIEAVSGSASQQGYPDTGSFDTLPSDASVTYLRGRVTIVPEISIFVNGIPRYVPIGTTVHQVISSFASLPFAAEVAISGLEYYRAVGSIVDRPGDAAPSYPFGRVNAVAFGAQALAPYLPEQYGPDFFDLPVIHGDWLNYRV